MQEKKGGKEKGREKEGRMDVRIEGMEEGGGRVGKGTRRKERDKNVCVQR